MRESDLRGYIRREISLTEAAGDFSAQDVKDVWGAFMAPFKIFGTALKSLLSVLVLNVEIVFRTDPQKIKEAFSKYETLSGRLAQEYDEVVGPIIKEFGEVEPLLFVANPGAYIAYQFTKEGATDFRASRDFFKDVGIDIGDTRWLDLSDTLFGYDRSDPNQRANADQTRLMAGLGGGRSAGSPEQIAKTQKQIQQTLDTIFGMTARVSEGVLLEQNELDPIDAVEKFYTDGVKELPPDLFGIDDEAPKKVADLKRDQANELAKILEAPLTFMSKLASAKTLEEVKAAISLLENTPYVIDGVKQLTPEFLESSAKKAVDAATKKKKLDDLFKQIGVKKPADEKGMIEAVKAFQLRNLLAKAVLDVRAALTKQMEDLREQFLEKYESDTPLKVIEKVMPGSEIESTVKAGIEKIRTAGKRTSQ